MNQAKLILVAALIGLSSAAMAATTPERDQRMNHALENYRSGGAAAKHPAPGRLGRAEEATKRGVRKAGHAVKTTAKRTGHGIATGARKTGDALHRTGEKIKKSTTPAK